jgi:hypothetical protein
MAIAILMRTSRPKPSWVESPFLHSLWVPENNNGTSDDVFQCSILIPPSAGQKLADLLGPVGRIALPKLVIQLAKVM